MYTHWLPYEVHFLRPYVQSCLTPFAFFAIVMFIGVLPGGSAIRKNLIPIRGSLSIIASLLACGHIFFYLNSYLGRMVAGFSTTSPMVALSLTISGVLVLLLLLLAATSINALKSRMKKRVWSAVQSLAYPFFLLIYVHLFLFFAPLLATGNSDKTLTFIVYTAVFGAYTVLRVRKAILERNRQRDLCRPI